MEAAEIVQLLVGTPLSAVLLYLLIAEQRAHTETRKARDQDNRDWMLRYSELAKQSAVALEAVEDALLAIRNLNSASPLTRRLK